VSDPVKLGVMHFNYLSEDIPAYLSHEQELPYCHRMELCYSIRKASSAFPAESDTGVGLFLLCTPCTLLLKQLPIKQKVLEALSITSIPILVKVRRKCDNIIKSISRK